MKETTALIKRIRARGLSQTEISRKTGIPQSRLSRWESGATPAGADDALLLAALERALLAQPQVPDVANAPAAASGDRIETYLYGARVEIPKPRSSERRQSGNTDKPRG